MKKMTLRIRGFVQGVGFRQTILQAAQAIDIVGYVRNMKDGSVEVIAEGEEEALQELFEVCEVGPRTAMIEDIEDVWETIGTVSFDEFSIRYS